MFAVLHVLYVIFDEGYTATSGPDLQRAELTHEAIRITREVRRRLPDDGELAGPLALMLVTDARRPARTRADGALVPLASRTAGAGTARRSRALRSSARRCRAPSSGRAIWGPPAETPRERRDGARRAWVRCPARPCSGAATNRHCPSSLAMM